MLRIFFLLFLVFPKFAFTQVPAQSIPEFEFFRFDHSRFSHKDLPKGKMKFFLFFDTECEHCHRAIENLNQNFKSFAVTSMYLVSLDDPKSMKDMINTYGPKLMKQKNVLLLQDSNHQFISKFQPRRYPSMYLYAADNKLVDYEDNEESVFRIVKFITE